MARFCSHNLLACSLFFVAAFLQCGCQSTAQIKASRVDRIADPSPKSICVLEEATDGRANKSDKVGQITFSLFMIPAGVVVSEDAVEKSVGLVVSEALKQAGFEVTTVEKVDEAEGPVFGVQVDSMQNYLFSWLWPVGLTFGRAQITPVLFDNSGKVLWQGTPCSGSGFCPSAIYLAGFDTSIRMEMNAVLNDLFKQIQSSEFEQSFSKSQPSSAL